MHIHRIFYIVCEYNYDLHIVFKCLSFVQVDGLTYLPLWENVTNYLQEIKLKKQLAFFIISYVPYLKYIAQIPNRSLWSNQLIFIIFRLSIIYRTIIGCPKTILVNIVWNVDTLAWGNLIAHINVDRKTWVMSMVDILHPWA